VSRAVLGAALVVAGYLSGSIPWGVVLGRVLLGVDPRTVGSGNIGATNVARAGGKMLGAVVLLLDALKAVVPVLVARWVLTGGPDEEGWTVAVALAAFAGHLWPPWLGFRGGKGVATGLGVFLVLSPWAALAGVAVYGVSYAATRISSVGSLLGTAVCAIWTLLASGLGSPVSWAGLAIAALVFVRHRDNIARIVRGEERRMRV